MHSIIARTNGARREAAFLRYQCSGKPQRKTIKGPLAAFEVPGSQGVVEFGYMATKRGSMGGGGGALETPPADTSWDFQAKRRRCGIWCRLGVNRWEESEEHTVSVER